MKAFWIVDGLDTPIFEHPFSTRNKPIWSCSTTTSAKKMAISFESQNYPMRNTRK